MSKISDADLKSILQNPIIGPKNHFIADCSFCGKSGHFYINRNNQLWDCKKCSEEGNVYKLLHFINRLDLVEGFKSIDKSKIKSLFEKVEEDEEELILQNKSCKLPIGYKQLKFHEYLFDRGFTKKEQLNMEFGITSTIPSMKKYLIFPVRENNEVVGYLSRIALKKEDIKALEKKINKKVLRYRNKKGMNKANMLFGYDEISKNTKTVILVEGVFDKKSIDKILRLYDQQEIKCVCTFGKKISKNQYLKLLIKGVENLIIFQDEDAIKEMKIAAVELVKHFKTVKVTYTYGSDINESKEQDVLKALSNLIDAKSFYRKRVKLI